MLRTIRAFVVGGAGLACAAGLTGCTNFTGFSVLNRTDQTVNVEMLTLDNAGEEHVHSAALLSPGGTFTKQVTTDEFEPGMRARFMLAGQPVSANNWVMLGINGSRPRTFNLDLVNGHLVARELIRGREVSTSTYGNAPSE